MKKVIRLTESDLTRLVKRVIEEQSQVSPQLRSRSMTGSDKMMDAVKPSSLTNLVNQSQGSATQKIDYKVLEKFLNAIDEGGSGYTSRWVLDSANPDKRSGSVKLTGKEAMVRMDYVNKPLVWSLVVNGKKEKGAIFQIFSFGGKLYYQVYSSIKSGQQNSSSYEELTPKTVGSAIQRFNQRVFLQEPRY
jgi:hypothetical protein